MNNCSYGVSTDVLHMGLSKVIVSTIGPYSCKFRKICSA